MTIARQHPTEPEGKVLQGESSKATPIADRC